MTARHRRRRHTAPGRRLRRWLRRRGRPSTSLFLAVIFLGALAAWLLLPSEDKKVPEPRLVRPTEKTPGSLLSKARPTVAAKPAPRARREATPPPPPKERTVTARPRPDRAPPRAAIVIDDLGQRLAHLEQLAAIGIPLTIAIIPGLPATAATVQEAARLGIEMLLHQPMEPRDEGGKDPGAGVLLTSMSDEEVRDRLRESLAAVPGAVGVNNHMGSRFTEETAGLGALMAELKARGLFWLDSRTSAATRGTEAARVAGVPAIERDVFLDAEVDPVFVRRQVRRLLARARARGWAVGIGHPHPETIATLRELRGELLDSGVTLVPLSALVPAAPGAGSPLAAATGGAGKEHPQRSAAAVNP